LGEFGPVFPFRDESLLDDLPYGMSEFNYYTRQGGTFNMFGLSVYFKKKIGLEYLFFANYNVNLDESHYAQYIESQFPNHYVTTSSIGGGYNLSSKAIRLCYQKHFRHFFIEPKLQLGINSVTVQGEFLRMKEKGSNHYIDYSVTHKNNNKSSNSYHALMCAGKRFNIPESHVAFELNLMTGFYIAPTDVTYTIETDPYGMPATTNEVTIKSTKSGFHLGLALRWTVGNF